MQKLFLKLGLLFALIVVATFAYLYLDYQRFKQIPLNIAEAQMLEIQAGSTFDAINEQLIKRQIVNKPIYLKLLARETGQATKIQSGEYQLTPGLTPLQLLELLVSGKVVQYTQTLVEGWHIREVLAALQANSELITTLDYSQPETLLTQLGYSEGSAEGLFFPDTYHFPRGTNDKAFLQRAYQRLETILQEEWEQRAPNLPYKTAYEALIMASIVEKETGLASERGQIAGVFVRRLEMNMKLQTDPTVIYAMGQQYDGNIRKKDLKIDSPHNTYRYRGLPPTPIALAGREAIHAALHPESGKTLYFVAKGDGSHYFSETLNEHNNAVAKYQLKRNR